MQTFVIKKKTKLRTLVLKTEPFEVDTEFLTPVSKNEKFLRNNAVIYVRMDSLPAGYYRILDVRNNSINIATEYGLVTVDKAQCYFTQELITGYVNQIHMVFEDTKASDKEDTEWIDEVLAAEARNNPINRIIL